MYKKIKGLLLCVAAIGVLAGCGAEPQKGEAVQKETPEEKTGPKAETKADAEEKSDTEAEVKTETDTDSDTDGDAKADTTSGTDAEMAWSFTATDLDGNEVTETVLSEKKLTMVNYWATFCGPCLREMPDLGELNEEYADKGFQIIGIVTDVAGDKNLDTAIEVVAETGASYLHLPLSQELFNGPVSSVMAVPTTVFVDAQGKQVGEIVMRAKEKDDWAALIDAYLEMV